MPQSYLTRLMDIAYDPQWATLQGPREAFMLKCESRDKLTDALFAIVPKQSETYEALPEIIDGEWEADRSEAARIHDALSRFWLDHPSPSADELGRFMKDQYARKSKLELP